MYERSARRRMRSCRHHCDGCPEPIRQVVGHDHTCPRLQWLGAPTEGSQQSQTTSPLRRSGPSVVFIAEQLELSGLEVSQNLAGIRVLGCIVSR